jgi:oxygen-independent coproporphyrinogen-3 oxidase
MQSEFLAIIDYLESIGWHHYELSNFAKPWYESVHNQSYWDHSETRGFGLSAASFEWGVRWSNSSSFTGYYASKKDNEETLTPEQIKLEEMMFWLRRDGWIAPLPPFTGGLRAKKLDTLISDWLIEITENRIKPTKTWIFVIDHILSEPI